MKYILIALGEIVCGLLFYFVFGFTFFQTLCLSIVVGIVLFILFGDNDDFNGSAGAVDESALVVYPGHQTVASPF